LAWPGRFSEGDVVGSAVPFEHERFHVGAARGFGSLRTCKEFERLGHEVGMKLEYRPMSGIRIDDEIAVRETSRQIVGAAAWNHTVAVAIGDKHGLMDL
jgi:hypothetical protein